MLERVNLIAGGDDAERHRGRLPNISRYGAMQTRCAIEGVAQLGNRRYPQQVGEKTDARSLLRELRETQGRSLRGAASDLSVTASYLSRLERGERGLSEEVRERISSYYGISSELLALMEGVVPADIIEILKEHPEELTRLRREYGER